jgi:hypothetical protein
VLKVNHAGTRFTIVQYFDAFLQPMIRGPSIRLIDVQAIRTSCCLAKREGLSKIALLEGFLLASYFRAP